ncbi:MAG: TIGR04141 family sporadically distributed protein [Cytophagales bacterium]|nr:TIGR04141 family sporadically distributed protein [Cytophagales bacterium]
MIDQTYNDIKIYQIDLNFYEFKGFNSDYSRVIDHIISYHKKNFKSDYELTYFENTLEIDPCNYRLYTFNEQEKESIWKEFLPSELIGENDFTLKSTSFSLFIQVANRLFAVIGGIGISVIKRFSNVSFGLDFYEKIAEPAIDIVHTETSRGVSGNLTSEQRTFRNEQRLQDVLSIGRVPNKFYLQLRQELKDSVFEFIDFDGAENIYLEIGAAFCIKWKISFNQLHELIIRINDALNMENSASLSRFERINDPDFTQGSLLPALLTHLRDDIVKLLSPNTNYNQLLDYDFIHPSKWQQFYECDSYKAYLKGARKPFFETHDRTQLYHEVLKHVYSLVEPTDESNFRRILLGVRIKGFVGETRKTEAMFINHLTCEIPIGLTPHFFIDNRWYKVKGSFIDNINEQCLQILKRNILTPNPLDLPWNHNSENEGDYNLKYTDRENYWVLDKMLGQNIELCDIAVLRNNNLYLIHVKDGFDAKIRDLTNQVSISAQRLWNDLKSDMSFLNEVYDTYSQGESNVSGISRENFYRLFTENTITYVMAFTTNQRDKTILGNLDEHKSNIAKFSVIQSFQERIDNYPIQIVEIKKLHTPFPH